LAEAEEELREQELLELESRLLLAVFRPLALVFISVEEARAAGTERQELQVMRPNGAEAEAAGSVVTERIASRAVAVCTAEAVAALAAL
jgi:hypothetical protein